MLRIITLLSSLIILIGCGVPATDGEIAATAIAQGCWPYGAYRPPATPTGVPTRTYGPTTPTRTLTPTRASSPTSTATDILMGTPVDSFPECTPVPGVPTHTPTAVRTSTPYPRATPRPSHAGRSNPQNASNMPGWDFIGNIAVHPEEGWPAMVWYNMLPEYADEARIWVRVYNTSFKGWDPPISVGGVWAGPTPGPTTALPSGIATGDMPLSDAVGKGGGEPAITIDRRGVIHVLYGEWDGPAMYTRSSDRGRSWSQPRPLPMPDGGEWAIFMGLKVDSRDRVHALYDVYWGEDGPYQDRMTYAHAVLRPDDQWAWEWNFLPGRKQFRGDLAFVDLSNGTIRTVAMLGCFRDCPQGQHPVIGYQDEGGPWVYVPQPDDWRFPREAVFYVSGTAFTDRAGRAAVCFAWGQYSASGVFNRCSYDGGQSWGPLEVINYVGDNDWLSPTGYHPTLIYVPSADALVAVWTLREPGDPAPYYNAWSYRSLNTNQWTPNNDFESPNAGAPMKLFSDTPLANTARAVKMAYNGRGLAWVTWAEPAQDDVFMAAFNPTGLLGASGGQ